MPLSNVLAASPISLTPLKKSRPSFWKSNRKLFFRRYRSYSPKPKPLPSLSALELKRAAESILEQVDWKKVAMYVASNRGSRMYKRMITALLQEKIDELYDKEEEEDQMEPEQTSQEEEKIEPEQGTQGDEQVGSN